MLDWNPHTTKTGLFWHVNYKNKKTKKFGVIAQESDMLKDWDYTLY